MAFGGPADTRSSAPRTLTPGSPEPLGVTPDDHGVNVAVYSANADAIELCLFDAAGERETERIRLPERTGNVWHAHVAGLAAGARYGLRAHGPYAPDAGHRFNPAKLLVDPYALALDRPFSLHPSQFGFVPATGRPDGSDSAPFVPKAVVSMPAVTETWVGAPSWERMTITEVHVRGFSKLHPGVPEAQRGTFAGLASPASIAHFQKLGVSTVELMPAAAWVDERHLGPLGLGNYWGYNPVAMMAPDARLAPGGWAEVRGAVAALNAAGLEVLLDVVFNHTGEGDAGGPTLSFRGLDNASYYRLDPRDGGYINDAGCGNILAADSPPVVRLVLDALRAWARHGGVNGFRFDLATTLGRRRDGFDPAASILAAIEQDPLLRGLKLIAEPWDIGPGGYQVGAFDAPWGEWNDKFRDGVRRFWSGGGSPGEFATRVAGSSDVFGRKRRPSRSVNYVSAHDGFTLADLVAYAGKHNEVNGEHNNDGTNGNWSWNNGVEGPSTDPTVTAARLRDQKNLIATLMLSRGTPMLGPGSELGHTQGGNNNAYAQDNATSWLDWSTPDHPLIGFIRDAAALRAAHPAVSADRFLTGAPQGSSRFPDAAWRLPDGRTPAPPDWEHPATPTLIGTLCAPGGDEAEAEDRVTLVFHAGREPLRMSLPECRDGFRWRVALDTDAGIGPAATRIFGGEAEAVVAPRSVVVFVEEAGDAPGVTARPAATDVVDRVAAAAGIAPEWFEVAGTRHAVSPDTKRALLAGMGLPVGSSGEARASLSRLAARALRPLAERTGARAGEPVRLRVVGAAGSRGVTVRGEDGDERRWPIDLDNGETSSFVAPDGRAGVARAVLLPALPAGRYALALDGAPDARCALTVAPARCFLPDSVRAGRRLVGVAAHLYTLRRAGDGGIGDFETLARFAEGAGRVGAHVVGLNPMHAQFDAHRERASPYHPSDRRFLDPLYLDVTAPDLLAEAPEVATAIEAGRAGAVALEAARLVDYPAVWRNKQAVLEAAFAGFDDRRRRLPDAADVMAFDAFVARFGAALQRFAAFQAIAEARGGQPWTAWEEALRHPGDPAVAAFAEAYGSRVRFHTYLQWLCESQFAAAARRADGAGLALGFYRDLAVGAAPDGAEAWAEPDYFARCASVGAPPDPFSAEGQIWCLPPPNPLAASAGAVLGHLLAANMRHAGALRIDHAMGLSRLFWVPDGARGADGAYVSYPFEDNLAELALESHRARCLVVGEDLGTVAPGFRERLGDADVLSYRVMFFERDGLGFLPPASYPAKAVACVSTHDLPTLAGWWAGADLADRRRLGLAGAEASARAERDRVIERENLAAAAGEPAQGGAPAQGDAPALPAAVRDGVHRFVASTPCVLAVAQADDLAGETEAVNLPGTDAERPNWRRRLAPDVDDFFGAGRPALPVRS